jgi:hypothetical protein
MISGTVIDSNGQPVEGVSVSAFRFVYDENGERTLARAGIWPTDDRGEFEMSVAPGEYILRAGAETGSRKAVVPTFYPDALEFSKAATVTVRAGDEIRLRPLIVQNAPLLNLSARLVDQTGTELNLPRLAVWRKGDPGILATRNLATSFLKLPPGSYEVEAGETTMRSPTSSPDIIGATLARTSIEVRDADVTLRITVPAGARTAIRALQEKEGALKAVPDVPTILAPRDSFLLQPFNGKTDTTGSFTLTSVPAGSYRFRVTAPANLCLQEIRQDDITIPGEDVHIRGSNMNISAIFHESTTSIQGKAVDRSGAPGMDAIVALVPDDRKQTRAYAATNADQDGDFEFRCALPGSYRLYAWTSLPGEAYRNEEFMVKFEGQGTAVRIGTGGSVTARVSVNDP